METFDLGNGVIITSEQIDNVFARPQPKNISERLAQAVDLMKKWWDRRHPFAASERRGRQEEYEELMVNDASLLPQTIDGATRILSEEERMQRGARRLHPIAS